MRAYCTVDIIGRGNVEKSIRLYLDLLRCLTQLITSLTKLMEINSMLKYLFLLLLLSPLCSADLRMVSIGGDDFLAYGTIPATGTTIGSQGVCNWQVQNPPNAYYRNTGRDYNACMNFSGGPIAYVRQQISGPGLLVHRANNCDGGTCPPGATGIFIGTGVGNWFVTGVTEGPKPVMCSVSKSLIFDYGTHSPGLINQTADDVLPVECSGKTSGKLTLRESKKGTIALGKSGLTATITANNSSLGSKIAFAKGTTSVTISSALSGTTSATGVQSGSGVLVLDVQ